MKYLFFTLFTFLSLNAHFDDTDLSMFEKKCMICHDTYKKNDIAPPIIAINQRYKKFYGNIDLSINKIKDFLILPTHKKAIMQPAIKLYNLMPKQKLNKKELEAYPEIIMLLDYQVPQWFDEHYKSHNLKDNNKNKLP